MKFNSIHFSEEIIVEVISLSISILDCHMTYTYYYIHLYNFAALEINGIVYIPAAVANFDCILVAIEGTYFVLYDQLSTVH